MRLDHRAHIFQNLNGAQDEVGLMFHSNETFLQNSIYGTRAAVYHGNGPSKVHHKLIVIDVYDWKYDNHDFICGTQFLEWLGGRGGTIQVFLKNRFFLIVYCLKAPKFIVTTNWLQLSILYCIETQKL